SLRFDRGAAIGRAGRRARPAAARSRREAADRTTGVALEPHREMHFALHDLMRMRCDISTLMRVTRNCQYLAICAIHHSCIKNNWGLLIFNNRNPAGTRDCGRHGLPTARRTPNLADHISVPSCRIKKAAPEVGSFVTPCGDDNNETSDSNAAARPDDDGMRHGSGDQQQRWRRAQKMREALV